MIYLKEESNENNQMLKGYRFLISALLVASAVTPCFAFASPQLWTHGYGKNRNPLIYEKMSTLLKASQQVSTPKTCFAPHNPPFLAVITEPDACDTEERMAETVQAMSSAVSTGKVALVSVRVVAPKHDDESAIDFQQRVVSLTTQLVELSSQYSFRVVVTSDWVDAAIQAGAHGIHVKERDRERIPEIRKEFATPPLIGTSAHNILSALEATSLYQPDYMFVGTCYPTQSHPEKTKLEGPALSGQICRALEQVETAQKRPVVLAIGGINEENCAEPILTYGADGVAAIRSVLQSPNPAKSVETMVNNMMSK